MGESWIIPRARRLITMAFACYAGYLLAGTVSWFEGAVVAVMVLLFTYDSYHAGYEDGIESEKNIEVNND